MGDLKQAYLIEQIEEKCEALRYLGCQVGFILHEWGKSNPVTLKIFHDEKLYYFHDPDLHVIIKQLDYFFNKIKGDSKMTNEERFGLVWEHYHKQIDENRAVHKSLDEMREEIKNILKNNSVINQNIDKYAYLLGFAVGGIRGFCDKNDEEKLKNFSKIFEEKINSIFYERD